MLPMKTQNEQITQGQLETMLSLASQTVPATTPLKGQTEVAAVLKDRGCSNREISRFLTKHGLAVSPTAVRLHFARKQND